MKGIIVVNMPESCEKCHYFGLNSNHESICIHNEIAGGESEIANKDIRPDWCPIRPVPEEKPSRISKCLTLEQYFTYRGWNTCIMEILKGENE